MDSVEEAKQYVINKIKASEYPDGHPFLADTFQHDMLFLNLVMVKIVINETVLLDDYLTNKLKANERGVFSLERYFQGLNEFLSFYYLLMGIKKSEMINRLFEIRYEPDSIVMPEKKLEYGFVFTKCEGVLNVAFEVKTITCDPFIKEDTILNFSQTYIKRYFNNVNLLDSYSPEELEKYIILNKCTHYRQLRDNIKDINVKFIRANNFINIGIVICQFATSLHEFFSYLFNPSNGLFTNNPDSMSNIDCLVLFSSTPRPDLEFDDLYDSGHVLTIINRKSDEILEVLKAFRLDNIIALPEGCIEEIKPWTEKDHGRFRLYKHENKIFFAEEGLSSEEIDEYIKSIS